MYRILFTKRPDIRDCNFAFTSPSITRLDPYEKSTIGHARKSVDNDDSKKEQEFRKRVVVKIESS